MWADSGRFVFALECGGVLLTVEICENMLQMHKVKVTVAREDVDDSLGVNNSRAIKFDLTQSKSSQPTSPNPLNQQCRTSQSEPIEIRHH